MQWNGSGGFAAQGGTLTVALNGGAALTWGTAPFGVSGGLIFGSPTADSPVIFTNNVILNNGSRVIWVIPGVGPDYAEITGNLTSSGTKDSITKSGNGTLSLTGANSYPGGTTINGGILQIGGGGNSGTLGSGTVTDNAALVFNRSDNGLVVSNVITGSGSLAQIGAGTVAVSGNNTYTGGTTLAAGTLVLANTSGSALGSGVLTLNGGTLAGTAFAGTVSGLVQAGSSPHTIAPGRRPAAGPVRNSELKRWLEHERQHHAAVQSQPCRPGERQQYLRRRLD